LARSLAACTIVSWLALATWFAALVAGGVAAMNVFGTLPETPMLLPEFERAPRSEHGRIAAGLVMAGVFSTVDLMRCIAAPLAVATLALQALFVRLPRRAWSRSLRDVCVVAAALLVAWYALALGPRMDELLGTYWQAARSGALEEARTALGSFEVLHRRADALYRAELLLVLTALAASAVIPCGRTDGAERAAASEMEDR
jgi:hypothetical protein